MVLDEPKRKEPLGVLAEVGGECFFSSIYYLLCGRKSGMTIQNFRLYSKKRKGFREQTKSKQVLTRYVFRSKEHCAESALQSSTSGCYQDDADCRVQGIL